MAQVRATKGTTLIEATRLVISNGDVETLEKLLGQMRLNKLDAERADALLHIFIETARVYNRVNVISTLMDAWRVVYPDVENIPFYSSLYTNYRFKGDTMRFIAKAYPTVTYLEVMSDLVNGDDSVETEEACLKLDYVYGPQDLKTYKFLLKLAEKGGPNNIDANVSIYNHLARKIKKIGEYADIPKWVNNKLEEIPSTLDLLPPKDEPKFTLPSDDKIVDLIVKSMSNSGLAFADVTHQETAVRKLLSTMVKAEKMEMVKPILEYEYNSAKQGDEYLFRILGPANLGPESSNTKYGGERMFTCDIYDYDEEEDMVRDWFTGACDVCFKRIRERWHAVRMPRPGTAGGWRGQYCTWKCCRDAVVELEKVELLTISMINVYEKYMNEIGIQSRTRSKRYPDIVWAGQLDYLEDRDMDGGVGTLIDNRALKIDTESEEQEET